MVFADEGSPASMAGFFDVVAAMWRDEPAVTEAFKSGKGVGWQEHHACLFRGTERFFRTSYVHHLIGEWLPALEGRRPLSGSRQRYPGDRYGRRAVVHRPLSPGLLRSNCEERRPLCHVRLAADSGSAEAKSAHRRADGSYPKLIESES
jgi:hypothetical protein